MPSNSGFADDVGGGVFWTLILLIGLSGLVYLAIWSFHSDSVGGIALSSIFSLMILIGIVFSRFEIFSLGGWGESCLSFTLGFLIWVFLGGVDQNSAFSVFSVSQNSLFASIASEMPRFVEMTMNNFIIPVAEEALWLIGIPFAIIAIMNGIGKGWAPAKNVWLQLVVIILVSGATFAMFHVGKLFLAFLIAAFVFRAIMLMAVVGDAKFNLIPGIALVPSFSVGAHIGNNLSQFGFGESISLLNQNFMPIGLLIYLLFAIFMLSALNYVGNKFKGSA